MPPGMQPDIYMIYIMIDIWWFSPQDKKLFTPGPLGCSLSTKQAMLRDLGSRDSEFIKVLLVRFPTHLLFKSGGSRCCRILFFFNNHICLYDYLTCESKDLKVFKSRLWRGSGPPCWKWPVSPIRTGAPSCSRSISLQATRTSTSTNKQE